MILTDLPFREYFDLSGKPLDGGYIYIGQPNQNPETAPVAVFWDAAGTQPAVQPVRTGNGLTVHNGAIANLFVVGEYSITIRDRNGLLVCYAPSSYDFDPGLVLRRDLSLPTGAALVGFDGTTLDQFFKSRSNRVVDSIAALKALDKTKYTRAFVTQYYGALGATAPDGGGGSYFYDSTDTTSADNGGTIIVATDGGRWKLDSAGPVNIRQFGAKGDGITDDTAAFQAAVTWAETFTFDAFTGAGRPSIRVPAGKYLTGTITSNKRLRIYGDGMASTFIVLKGGVLTSLFILNAEDVAGASVDDTNHHEICDMTLLGNRVDSVTTGTSYGIFCPTTLWSMATQYSPSVIATNLNISGFTGDGIHLGVNRNWALMTNIISRYNNDNGIGIRSYDNRFVNCDFGVNKNYGVREYTGGANSFLGCNFYVNTYNLIVNSGVNSPSWYANCSFDAATQHGVYIDNSSGVDGHSFIGCRFSGNSSSLANTYSDIYLAGPEAVTVSACQFIFSVQKTKHLVENTLNTLVGWHGNQFDSSGGASTPYGAAVTNTPANLMLAGDRRSYLYPASSANEGILGFMGPVKLKDYVKAALPPVASGANCMIMVTDDIGGLTPAFSDGVNWRRVADRAVIA